jgi:hypothetical protein
MKYHRKTIILLACLVSVAAISCTTLQQIGNAVLNLKRCSFKLENVANFSLMGVNLSSKRSISDFNLLDAAKLASGFARKEFPASFILNVAAINPNDGTGGSSQSAATLTSFAWTMILDNKTTISGDITQPITIPGTGQKSIIPLQMNLDLAKFFGDQGYESVANLALALGGVNSSPARITLKAKPRLSTDFGVITYPGEISIIDKEFRSQ